MLRWFRHRDDDDDDFEDDDELEAGEGDASGDIPEFALVVAETEVDGWHMAAVLADSTSPAFYVRAITVRWPFEVARPVPSNRKSDRPINPERLSPSGSTPSRKLVVNWGWEQAEETVVQLRFFVKHGGLRWLRRSGRLSVRLTLKESAWPRRRIVVPVKSNPVDWKQQQADAFDDEFEEDEVAASAPQPDAGPRKS